MKFFQWVHRKHRQNSIEPFKDFTFGNPSTCLTVKPTLDNQYSHTKPCFSSINQPNFSKSHNQENQISYSGLVDSREDRSQEETTAICSQLFEGFLTIGTLGTETETNEPGTPTFAEPSGNIPMGSEKVTENELKLITYELEKFLEAEREESFHDSSGRNSYVSTITLCGKEIDGPKAEDYRNKAVCPLQGYLLGSSFELPETKQVSKKRASLAELLYRTKATSQDCTETGIRGETHVKETHKSAVRHIMRKVLKKVCSSSKSCNTSRKDADSASTNKKLHKALRLFHRKVYPESPINGKDCIKSHKDEIQYVSHKFFHEYDNRKSTNPDNGKKFHPDTKSREWSQQRMINWNQPQLGQICSSSTGNNEHWIRTDAECKYYIHLECNSSHTNLINIFH
ncbi:protein LAZY 1-like [Vigna umbellata]|uniref:protein LAZY 1-like n=1 Tax=Vigna umbellata TaxID=87088 RepID=UPI001F5EE6F7|nr:protein LAZY 1-like [Vigna umbellata]